MDTVSSEFAFLAPANDPSESKFSFFRFEIEHDFYFYVILLGEINKEQREKAEFHFFNALAPVVAHASIEGKYSL